MKAVIIAGSARSDGFTMKVAGSIASKTHWDLIDLNSHRITHYDYTHQNKDDDFLPLMKNLIATYDTFVLATPVYWYSMSGIMKVFFDRLSDLVTIEKQMGRTLKGKRMGVLSCSNGDNLGDAFWLPFEATANYLDMELVATAHFTEGSDTDSVADRFISHINNQKTGGRRTQPFRIDALDHAAIRVDNLENAAAWYHKILGLTRYSPEEWGPFPIFMMSGRSGIALFPKKKDPKDHGERLRKCVDHFAFRVDPDNYEIAKTHFRANRVQFKEQDHVFFTSVYIEDPDGNTVELTTLKPGMEYFYDLPENSSKL